MLRPVPSYTRLVFLGGLFTFALSAAGEPDAALERDFIQKIRPFLATYCVGCHGTSPAAQLDLRAYPNLHDVVRDYSRWSLVREKLSAGQMPPKFAKQPPDALRQQTITWIVALRDSEARKNAGDPGQVLARRLSNAEYNYTIRDLTGVDLRPAREFPVDPANTAGFDNSGESLTMSPALLDKYLLAARDVALHMAFTPDGVVFAPYPMLVETDREKFAIQRILDFYERQPTDYADYFRAAWRFKHRADLGQPKATLDTVARGAKVAPHYLARIWSLLEDSPDAVGPIAKLQAMWRALPPPGSTPAELRARCVEMRDFVVRIRQHTAMQFAAPVVKGLPPGSQPLLNWKLRAFAMHHRDSDPQALLNDTDPPAKLSSIPRYAGLHQEAAPRWAAVMAEARVGDVDLIVPGAERSRYEAAFARFASVFPDTFYVRERGRYWPDDSQDKGRALSAGYHNVMGYYRDDAPLMELILDEKGRKELDRLWEDFDFMADFTNRTWDQYYFNQSGEVEGRGAESGSERPVGKPLNATEVIYEFRDKYLAKAAANPANDPIAPTAIRDHFERVNATLRHLERLHAEAEPRHLDALLAFAARAYRRPLTAHEREGTLAYYRTLREKDALSHEDAMRECVVSVLVSPKFCYRMEAAGASVPEATRTEPLPPYALASRLSYFLWSSMPDDELLARAATGDLAEPAVLKLQARRMLLDDRALGLAVEFGGNWLDFRRFEKHNAVDRERFPVFTNKLREAMFQEPVHLLRDLIRNDRSVLDLIYGNYTFVNPDLAKLYGIPDISGDSSKWVRIDNASQFGRGGLLPMAVFLTQNAPGLRTSPVKRGFWVVKRVLGEEIPPPPPNVPELPHDEAKLDLPLRDVLARHRQNPACASCHARFDSFGLSFEGYGPVGEKRNHDLAGHPVDAHATYPDGSQGDGLEGVRSYIREHRQRDFIDNFCRKLLVYSLGRSLLLSDEPLIDQMKTGLAANDYRFSTLVEAIVTSPQFMNRRSRGSP